jgi:hypothetical protein
MIRGYLNVGEKKEGVKWLNKVHEMMVGEK